MKLVLRNQMENDQTGTANSLNIEMLQRIQSKVPRNMANGPNAVIQRTKKLKATVRNIKMAIEFTKQTSIEDSNSPIAQSIVANVLPKTIQIPYTSYQSCDFSSVGLLKGTPRRKRF